MSSREGGSLSLDADAELREDVELGLDILVGPQAAREAIRPSARSQVIRFLMC